MARKISAAPVCLLLTGLLIHPPLLGMSGSPDVVRQICALPGRKMNLPGLSSFDRLSVGKCRVWVAIFCRAEHHHAVLLVLGSQTSLPSVGDSRDPGPDQGKRYGRRVSNTQEALLGGAWIVLHERASP